MGAACARKSPPPVAAMEATPPAAAQGRERERERQPWSFATTSLLAATLLLGIATQKWSGTFKDDDSNVADFFALQLVNRGSEVIFFLFAMLVPSLTMIICITYPGQLATRMVFTLGGVIGPMAISLPAMCTYNDACTKSTPRIRDVDGILGVVFGAAGPIWIALVLWDPNAALTWAFYLIGFPALPALYDCFGELGQPSLQKACFAGLALFQFVASVACWRWALQEKVTISSFAENWATINLFVDYVVCVMCVVLWVQQWTNDWKLTVLTICFPSTGLNLAFAFIVDGGTEYSEVKNVA